MLIYERKKKRHLQEVALEAAETTDTSEAASLECANTALSRAASIPFKGIKTDIPSWIAELVSQDNQAFLRDRQLFDSSFFNFIKLTLKHVAKDVLYSAHKYSYEFISVFDNIKKQSLLITRKAILDMLSCFLLNTSINDITESCISIINFSDSAPLIKREGHCQSSILVPFARETFLEDKGQSFFEIMFSCTDKSARFYLAKFTSGLVNRLFKIYDETDDKGIEQLLRDILSLFIEAVKSPDCAKNWSRFDQYFKMLCDIAYGGLWQVDFMLREFNTIVILIDFMLNDKSPLLRPGEQRPKIGSSVFSASIENIVRLVSSIIRFIKTEQKEEEDEEEEEGEQV